MLPYQQHGSQALADGYAVAAELAEERQQVCEAAGIRGEAKQWSKIVTYCRVMARYRLLDEPNPRVRYEIPMPPEVIQDLIAKQVQEEQVWGDEWDGESIPPDDPRRPMKPERRFALAAALQMLGEQERVAAIMYWGWRLPKDLISEAMGMETGTLDRTLARAKAKFKRIYAEESYLDSLTARAHEIMDKQRVARKL